MIYNSTQSTTIHQGDIFFDLPFIDLANLDGLQIATNPEEAPETKTWEQVKAQPDIVGLVKMVPSMGIVISQDCDNVRKEYISFAKIDTLAYVLNKQSLPAAMKERLFLFTKDSSRRGYSHFYLPEGIGFPDKMAANLKIIFQLPRESLLTRLDEMRKGTLNEEALKHFRQTITYYFTRFANNEWYPLTPDEYEAYFEGAPDNEKPHISPYPYQRRR